MKPKKAVDKWTEVHRPLTHSLYGDDDDVTLNQNGSPLSQGRERSRHHKITNVKEFGKKNRTKYGACRSLDVQSHHPHNFPPRDRHDPYSVIGMTEMRTLYLEK